MKPPLNWSSPRGDMGEALAHLAIVSFICEADSRGSLVVHDCSEELSALAGVERDAVRVDPGLIVSRLVPHARRRLLMDERRNAEALTTLRGVYDLLHPTRGLRNIFLRAVPHRSPQGTVVWRGLAEDVTSVYGPEHDMRRLAERFGRALAATNDVVWEVALDETSPVTNEAGLVMPLSRWCAALHPEDRERVCDELRRLSSTDERFRIEFRMRGAGPGWIWATVRGRVSMVRNGVPMRLIGILTDISSRKAVQMQLAESETKLRAMFELAPVGMSRNAMDGRFLEVNQALLNLLGYEIEELLRLNYWDLTPTRYAADEASQLNALASLGRYGPYEKEFVHHDGHTVPVRLNGVLIRPVNGQPYIWSTVEDVSARHRLDEAIARNASFDAVTGLANRALAAERAERALKAAAERGGSVALISLDLDQFMPVNTTFGHNAGDRVLREVARRLVLVVGNADIVCRTGGDEFALLVDGEDEHVSEVCRQIIDAMARPFDVDGSRVRVGASLGVARAPTDASQFQDLSIRADLALQLAKSAGGSTYRFYLPSLISGAGTRLRTETALHEALAHEELELHYQPQIDLASGRCTSLEALVRWRTADGTLIAPGAFIPIAESSNLIFEIGDYVLNAACRDIRRWQQAGYEVGRIAINLSAREFQDEALATRIQALLARTGVAPGTIEVEITESAVMTDPPAAIATLQRLRSLGVAISLDDFGTGHSSLAYLKRLPLTALKIDRSFLEDLGPTSSARAIFDAIVRLGRELRLDVVAEGVETPEQEAFVRQVGCTMAQGFLFARPMPAGDVVHWLDRVGAGG